eukprot:ANDGO_04170.mRNA.1 hypothetical protein
MDSNADDASNRQSFTTSDSSVSSPQLFSNRFQSAAKAGEAFIPPSGDGIRIDSPGLPGQPRRIIRPKPQSAAIPIGAHASSTYAFPIVNPLYPNPISTSEVPDSRMHLAEKPQETASVPLSQSNPVFGTLKTPSGPSKLPPIHQKTDGSTDIGPTSPNAGGSSPRSGSPLNTIPVETRAPGATLLPPLVPPQLVASGPTINSSEFPAASTHRRRVLDSSSSSSVTSAIPPMPREQALIASQSRDPRRISVHLIVLWTVVLISCLVLGITTYSTWSFIKIGLGLSKDQYDGSLIVKGDLTATSVASNSVTTPLLTTQATVIEKPVGGQAAVTFQEGDMQLRMGTLGAGTKKFAIIDPDTSLHLWELDFESDSSVSFQSFAVPSSSPSFVEKTYPGSFSKKSERPSSSTAPLTPSLSSSTTSRGIVNTESREIRGYGSLDIVSSDIVSLSASNAVIASSNSVVLNGSFIDLRATSALNVRLDSRTANASFRISTSSKAVPFFVSQSGSVGVNTTTPGAMLHVVGDVLIEGALISNSSASGAFNLNDVVIAHLNTSLIQSSSAASDMVITSFPGKAIQFLLPGGSPLLVGTTLVVNPSTNTTSISGNLVVSGNWSLGGGLLSGNEAARSVAVAGSVSVSGNVAMSSSLLVSQNATVAGTVTAAVLQTSSLVSSSNASPLSVSARSVNFVFPGTGSTSLTVGSDVLFVDVRNRLVGIGMVPSSTDRLQVAGSVYASGNVTVADTVVADKLLATTFGASFLQASRLSPPLGHDLLINNSAGRDVVFSVQQSGSISFQPFLLVLNSTDRSITVGDASRMLSSVRIWSPVEIQGTAVFSSSVSVAGGSSLVVGKNGTTLSMSELVVSDGIRSVSFSPGGIHVPTVFAVNATDLRLVSALNRNVTIALTGPSSSFLVGNSLFTVDPSSSTVSVGDSSNLVSRLVVRGSAFVASSLLVSQGTVSLNETGLFLPNGSYIDSQGNLYLSRGSRSLSLNPSALTYSVDSNGTIINYSGVFVSDNSGRHSVVSSDRVSSSVMIAGIMQSSLLTSSDSLRVAANGSMLFEMASFSSFEVSSPGKKRLVLNDQALSIGNASSPFFLQRSSDHQLLVGGGGVFEGGLISSGLLVSSQSVVFASLSPQRLSVVGAQSSAVVESDAVYLSSSTAVPAALRANTTVRPAFVSGADFLSSFLLNRSSLFLQSLSESATLSEKQLLIISNGTATTLNPQLFSIVSSSLNSSIRMSLSSGLVVANGSLSSSLDFAALRTRFVFADSLFGTVGKGLSLSATNGVLSLSALNGTISIGNDSVVVDSLGRTMISDLYIGLRMSVNGSFDITGSISLRPNRTITIGDAGLFTQIADTSIYVVSPQSSSFVSASSIRTPVLTATSAVVSPSVLTAFINSTQLLVTANETRFDVGSFLISQNGSALISTFSSRVVEIGLPVALARNGTLPNVRLTVDKDIVIGGEIYVQGKLVLADAAAFQIGSGANLTAVSNSGFFAQQSDSNATLSSTRLAFTSPQSSLLVSAALIKASITGSNQVVEVSPTKGIVVMDGASSILGMLSSTSVYLANSSSGVSSRLDSLSLNTSTVFTNSISPISGSSLSVGQNATVLIGSSTSRTAIGIPAGEASFVDGTSAVTLQIRGNGSLAGVLFADAFIARDSVGSSMLSPGALQMLDSTLAGAVLSRREFILSNGSLSSSLLSTGLTVVSSAENTTYGVKLVFQGSNSAASQLSSSLLQFSDSAWRLNVSARTLRLLNGSDLAFITADSFDLSSSIAGVSTRLSKDGWTLSNSSASAAASLNLYALNFASSAESSTFSSSGISMSSRSVSANYSMQVSPQGALFVVNSTTVAALSGAGLLSVSSLSALSNRTLPIVSAANQDIEVSLTGNGSSAFVVSADASRLLSVGGLNRQLHVFSNNTIVDGFTTFSSSIQLFCNTCSLIVESGVVGADITQITSSGLLLSNLRNSVSLSATSITFRSSNQSQYATLSSNALAVGSLFADTLRPLSAGGMLFSLNSSSSDVSFDFALSQNQSFRVGGGAGLKISSDFAGDMLVSVLGGVHGRFVVGNVSSSSLSSSSLASFGGSMFVESTISVGTALTFDGSGTISLVDIGGISKSSITSFGATFRSNVSNISISDRGLMLSGDDNSWTTIGYNYAQLSRLSSLPSNNLTLFPSLGSDVVVSLSNFSVKSRFVVTNEMLLVDASRAVVEFGGQSVNVSVLIYGNLQISRDLAVDGSLILQNPSSSFRVGNASMYSSVSSAGLAVVGGGFAAELSPASLRIYRQSSNTTAVVLADDSLTILSVKSPVGRSLNISASAIGGDVDVRSPLGAVRLQSDMMFINSSNIFVGGVSAVDSNLRDATAPLLSLVSNVFSVFQQNVSFGGSVLLASASASLTIRDTSSQSLVATVSPSLLLLTNGSSVATVSADAISFGLNQLSRSALTVLLVTSPLNSDLMITPFKGRDLFILSNSSSSLWIADGFLRVHARNKTAVFGADASSAGQLYPEDASASVQIYGSSVLSGNVTFRAAVVSTSSLGFSVSDSELQERSSLTAARMLFASLTDNSSRLVLSRTAITLFSNESSSTLDAASLRVNRISSSVGTLSVIAAVDQSIRFSLSGNSSSAGLQVFSGSGDSLMAVSSAGNRVSLFGDVSSAVNSSAFRFSVVGNAVVEGQLLVTAGISVLNSSAVRIGSLSVFTQLSSASLDLSDASNRNASLTPTSLQFRNGSAVSIFDASGASLAAVSVDTISSFSSGDLRLHANSGSTMFLSSGTGSINLADGLVRTVGNNTLVVGRDSSVQFVVGNVTDTTHYMALFGGDVSISGEMHVSSRVSIPSTGSVLIGSTVSLSNTGFLISGARNSTLSVQSNFFILSENGTSMSITPASLFVNQLSPSTPDHDLLITGPNVMIGFTNVSSAGNFIVGDGLFALNSAASTVTFGNTSAGRMLVKMNASFVGRVQFSNDIVVSGSSSQSFVGAVSTAIISASGVSVSASSNYQSVLTERLLLLTDGLGNTTSLSASGISSRLLSSPAEGNLALVASNGSLLVTVGSTGLFSVNSHAFTVNASSLKVSVGMSADSWIIPSAFSVDGGIFTSGSLHLGGSESAIAIKDSSSQSGFSVNSSVLCLSSSGSNTTISSLGIRVDSVLLEGSTLHGVALIAPTADLNISTSPSRNVLIDLQRGSRFTVGASLFEVSENRSWVSVGAAIAVLANGPESPRDSFVVYGNSWFGGNLSSTGSVFLSSAMSSLSVGSNLSLYSKMSVADVSLLNGGLAAVLRASSLSFTANSGSSILSSDGLLTSQVTSPVSRPLVLSASLDQDVIIALNSSSSRRLVVGNLLVADSSTNSLLLFGNVSDSEIASSPASLKVNGSVGVQGSLLLSGSVAMPHASSSLTIGTQLSKSVATDSFVSVLSSTSNATLSSSALTLSTNVSSLVLTPLFAVVPRMVTELIQSPSGVFKAASADGTVFLSFGTQSGMSIFNDSVTLDASSQTVTALSFVGTASKFASLRVGNMITLLSAVSSSVSLIAERDVVIGGSQTVFGNSKGVQIFSAGSSATLSAAEFRVSSNSSFTSVTSIGIEATLLRARPNASLHIDSGGQDVQVLLRDASSGNIGSFVVDGNLVVANAKLQTVCFGMVFCNNTSERLQVNGSASLDSVTVRGNLKMGSDSSLSLGHILLTSDALSVFSVVVDSFGLLVGNRSASFVALSNSSVFAESILASRGSQLNVANRVLLDDSAGVVVVGSSLLNEFNVSAKISSIGPLRVDSVNSRVYLSSGASSKEVLSIWGGVSMTGNLTINGSVTVSDNSFCTICAAEIASRLASNETILGQSLTLRSNGTRSVIMDPLAVLFKDGMQTLASWDSSTLVTDFISVKQVYFRGSSSGIDMSSAVDPSIAFSMNSTFRLRDAHANLDIARFNLTNAQFSGTLDVPFGSVNIGNLSSPASRLSVDGNVSVSDSISVKNSVLVFGAGLKVISASQSVAVDGSNITFSSGLSSAWFGTAGIRMADAGGSSSLTTSTLFVESVRISKASALGTLSLSSDSSTVDMSTSGVLRLRVDSTVVTSQVDLSVTAGRSFSTGTNNAGTLRLTTIDQDSVQVRGKDSQGAVVESRVYAGSIETINLRLSNITSPALTPLASIGITSSAVTMATWDASVRVLSGGIVSLQGSTGVQVGDASVVSPSTVFTVYGTARVRGSLQVDGNLNFGGFGSLSIGNVTVDPSGISVNGSASRSSMTAAFMSVTNNSDSSSSFITSNALLSDIVFANRISPRSGSSLSVVLPSSGLFSVSNDTFVVMRSNSSSTILMGPLVDVPGAAKTLLSVNGGLTSVGSSVFSLSDSSSVSISDSAASNSTVMFSAVGSLAGARARVNVGGTGNSTLFFVGDISRAASRASVDLYDAAFAGSVLFLDGFLVGSPLISNTTASVSSFGFSLRDSNGSQSSLSASVLSISSGIDTSTLSASVLQVSNVVSTRIAAPLDSDLLFSTSSNHQVAFGSASSANMSVAFFGSSMTVFPDHASVSRLIVGNSTNSHGDMYSFAVDGNSIISGILQVDSALRLLSPSGIIVLGNLSSTNSSVTSLTAAGLEAASSSGNSSFSADSLQFASGAFRTKVNSFRVTSTTFEGARFFTSEISASDNAVLSLGTRNTSAVVIGGPVFVVGSTDPSDANATLRTEQTNAIQYFHVGGGSKRVVTTIGNMNSASFVEPFDPSTAVFGIDGNATVSGTVSIHQNLLLRGPSSAFAVGSVVLNNSAVSVGSSAQGSRLFSGGLEVRDGGSGVSIVSGGSVATPSVLTPLIQCTSPSCTTVVAAQGSVNLRSSGTVVLQASSSQVTFSSSIVIESPKQLLIQDASTFVNYVMLTKSALSISGDDSQGLPATAIMNLDRIQNQLVKTQKIVPVAAANSASVAFDLSSTQLTLSAPQYTYINLNNQRVLMNASQGVFIGDAAAVQNMDLLTVQGNARIRGQLFADGGLSIAGGLGSSFAFGNVSIDGSSVSMNGGLARLSSSLLILKDVSGSNTTITSSAAETDRMTLNQLSPRNVNISVTLPPAGAFVVGAESFVAFERSVTLGASTGSVALRGGVSVLSSNMSIDLLSGGFFTLGSGSAALVKASGSRIELSAVNGVVIGQSPEPSVSADALQVFGNATFDGSRVSVAGQVVLLSENSSVLLAASDRSVVVRPTGLLVSANGSSASTALSADSIRLVNANASTFLSSSYVMTPSVSTDVIMSHSSVLSFSVNGSLVSSWSSQGLSFTSLNGVSFGDSSARTPVFMYDSLYVSGDILLQAPGGRVVLPNVSQSLLVGDYQSGTYVHVNSSSVDVTSPASRLTLLHDRLRISNLSSGSVVEITSAGLQVDVLTVSGSVVSSPGKDLVLSADSGQSVSVALSHYGSVFSVGSSMFSLTQQFGNSSHPNVLRVFNTTSVVLGSSPSLISLGTYGLVSTRPIFIGSNLESSGSATWFDSNPAVRNWTTAISSGDISVATNGSARTSVSPGVVTVRDASAAQTVISGSTITTGSATLSSVTGVSGQDLSIRAVTGGGVTIQASDASRRVDITAGSPGSSQFSVAASGIDVRVPMTVSGLTYMDSGMEIRSTSASIYIWSSLATASARLQASQLRFADTATAGTVTLTSTGLSLSNGSTGAFSLVAPHVISAPTLAASSTLVLSSGTGNFVVDASSSFSASVRFNDSVSFISTFSGSAIAEMSWSRMVVKAAGGLWIGANVTTSSTVSSALVGTEKMVVDGNVYVSGTVTASGGVNLASSNASIQVGASTITPNGIFVGTAASNVFSSTTVHSFAVRNGSFTTTLSAGSGVPFSVGDTVSSVFNVELFADASGQPVDSSATGNVSGVVRVGSSNRRGLLLVSSAASWDEALPSLVNYSRHVFAVDGDSVFGGSSSTFASSVTVLTPMSVSSPQSLLSVQTWNQSSGVVISPFAVTTASSNSLLSTTLSSSSLLVSNGSVYVADLQSTGLSISSVISGASSSLSADALTVSAVLTNTITSTNTLNLVVPTGNVSLQNGLGVFTDRRALFAASDGLFISRYNSSTASSLLHSSLAWNPSVVSVGTSVIYGSSVIFSETSNSSLHSVISDDGFLLMSNNSVVASFTHSSGLVAPTIGATTFASASSDANVSCSSTMSPGLLSLVKTGFLSNSSLLLSANGSISAARGSFLATLDAASFVITNGTSTLRLTSSSVILQELTSSSALSIRSAVDQTVDVLVVSSSLPSTNGLRVRSSSAGALADLLSVTSNQVTAEIAVLLKSTLDVKATTNIDASVNIRGGFPLRVSQGSSYAAVATTGIEVVFDTNTKSTLSAVELSINRVTTDRLYPLLETGVVIASSPSNRSVTPPADLTSTGTVFATIGSASVHGSLRVTSSLRLQGTSGQDFNVVISDRSVKVSNSTSGTIGSAELTPSKLTVGSVFAADDLAQTVSLGVSGADIDSLIVNTKLHGSAGSASQFIRVNIGGTYYKLQLFADS